MNEPDDIPSEITTGCASPLPGGDGPRLASRLLHGNPTDQECWQVASLLGDTGRLCQNRPPADDGE